MSDMDRKIYSLNEVCSIVERERADERAKTIDECKEILLSAIAENGKTKCAIYMKAVHTMELLKRGAE